MGRHMGGLGILFHRRGIERIDTVGLRNLYCEYRPVEVCIPVSSPVNMTGRVTDRG